MSNINLFFFFALDVFKHDPDFEANEEKYQAVKTEIIGDESSGPEGSDEDNDGSEDESGSEEEAKGMKLY